MQQVLTHSCPPRRPPALPLAETDGRLRELGHQLLERHGPAGTQDESDGIPGRAPAARIVLGRFAEREGAAVGSLPVEAGILEEREVEDRKSTRLNSSH